ncbi:VIT family protein [Oenococcus alcoholitolerans]|uniref:VIT1/CCC1 transporter family protein n=1 Tax=Oenococcus alcoholitolerans TaxID=931074 RepID=UPI003F70ED89
MTLTEKINIIRASVMGANDGIISVAGIVLGVFAATVNRTNSNWAIFIAGFAGTLAGMISMAAGEYVSVHGQRDAEKAAVKVESKLNKDDFEGQVKIVEKDLQNDQISIDLSHQAALEMMKNKPIETSVRVKHGFDIGDEVSPYHAAIASFFSFPLGATLPMAAILLVPKSYKIFSTYVGVLIALVITGFFAARIGQANVKNGIVRNVISGLFTMTATYLIGGLFGR